MGLFMVECYFVGIRIHCQKGASQVRGSAQQLLVGDTLIYRWYSSKIHQYLQRSTRIEKQLCLYLRMIRVL